MILLPQAVCTAFAQLVEYSWLSVCFGACVHCTASKGSHASGTLVLLAIWLQDPLASWRTTPLLQNKYNIAVLWACRALDIGWSISSKSRPHSWWQCQGDKKPIFRASLVSGPQGDCTSRGCTLRVLKGRFLKKKTIFCLFWHKFQNWAGYGSILTMLNVAVPLVCFTS